VGVQEVGWEKGGTERAEDYTFFCGEGNETYQLGSVFSHIRVVSAVRRREFISDRMPYIILRGLWCNINVLNVHAPCEDKSNAVKSSFCEELGCVFGKFPSYDVEIFLGDFSAKVGREDIFKPTIGNESLHEISNGSGVRAVNFATSKNLDIRSTSSLIATYIHEYSWTSPEGKTHNQLDYVLIDRRRHSAVLDIRSFRGADCDADHYLVVAEVR
jgi:hypothetical protein